MDIVGDGKDKNTFGDIVALLDEKNQIIRKQEKDIGSLKRELAVLKDELNCSLDEKE